MKINLGFSSITLGVLIWVGGLIYMLEVTTNPNMGAVVWFISFLLCLFFITIGVKLISE